MILSGSEKLSNSELVKNASCRCQLFLVHVLKELSIDLDFVEMASGRCCIWKVCQKD
jgi:hypothetical protein